jgi:hypothetical protein
MSNPEAKLDRSKVTFAQAEGVAALPRQLKIKELSKQLRALIWQCVYDGIQTTGGIYPIFTGPWETIFRDVWVHNLHNMIHKFENDWFPWERKLSSLFENDNYVAVFSFLQFLVRHDECPIAFKDSLQIALVTGHAAYRLVDDTIVPIASAEEGEAIAIAFDALSSGQHQGARAHLRSAADHLTKGEWAASVRESIHSVEAVIVQIAPKGKTLSDGLTSLEKSGKLNPNLKRAMNALYDYTSDEKGVRHAKVFETANVDEFEAIYMFGTCASFLTFVINKARVEA